MDNKKRLYIVLVVSLLTMVAYTTLASIIARVHLYALLGPEVDYYASNFLMPALIAAAAAVPGFFVLRHYKVPHCLSLSLFAALQTFCFIFAFTPIIDMYATWAINVAIFVCIASAYYLTHAVFNNWNTRFRYKIMAATGIAALAIVFDRTFALFS